MQEEEEEGVEMIALQDDVDVYDIEPLPPLTLKEAKAAVERLFAFVCINKDQVQEAGCTSLVCVASRWMLMHYGRPYAP